ncbi:PEP-utilizing enzyme [Hyphococcus sp.]|uniref:PEP-utilizing enzyme n=1 Tax=Hyphococcus sp. TaxID=2038636 RepID=UPI0035C78955
MAPVTARTDLVILGAGRPTGYGSKGTSADHPPGHAALAWVKQAVESHVDVRHFIAGFAAEKAAAALPDFHITLNPDWRMSGSIKTLRCAPVAAEKQALVCYADIVFHEAAAAALVNDPADISLAVDSAWKTRYAARTERDMAVAEKVIVKDGALAAIGKEIGFDEADAEFIGLVKFSPSAMKAVHDLGKTNASLAETGGVAKLISHFIANDRFSISFHDVAGAWAELNAPQDLARFVLGTKAETLDRLKPLVRAMRIEDQVKFSISEWERDEAAINARVRSAFDGAPVIVRSSSLAEDCWSTANAGVYTSLPDVDLGQTEKFASAVNEVIASYGPRNPDDQVLVQPMLSDVIANGVVFTRTLSHGAPYFVVNFDETEGATDGVTAGTGDLKVLYLHHDAPAPPPDAPSWMAGLVEGARELIRLVGYDTLDLEFAVTADGEICLLQLRPIAVDHDEWAIDDSLLREELKQAVARYREHERAAGGKTAFGVMPDWNPAEIVGTRPSLLSISLYRYLICDETWARQRAEYGYRDVRPQPLIVSFAGRPYVNVQASFSSFIPAGISDDLAGRLVDHYLTRLANAPSLHDKVEFNIAFTCLSFDFADRAEKELAPAGFSKADIDELRQGLAAVTQNGFARYREDFATIETLAARFDAIMQKPLSRLERACALLEDCRRFGTLPFAHLARSGFVAATLMRSAVAKGHMDQAFLDAYLNSTNTVARQFVTDGLEASSGGLSWEEFSARYGHLRPGTYDILSPAYHEDDGRLLRDAIGGLSSTPPHEAPKWPAGAWEKMQSALSKLGLVTDFSAFDDFVRRAIEGREYAKFVFTRNLSQALDDLVAFGAEIGAGRDLLAQIPFDTYLSLRAGEGFGDPGDFIRNMADLYEQRRMIALNAELPPLITDETQFHAFFYPPSAPNFVTSKSITADIIAVGQEAKPDPADLKGKIVVIPQADPGFDWLFGCEMAGLVTQYGGANSHMAIRAAEFGLPAAIGVGEVLFEKLQHAKVVLLDCLNQRLETLR